VLSSFAMEISSLTTYPVFRASWSSNLFLPSSTKVTQLMPLGERESLSLVYIRGDSIKKSSPLEQQGGPGVWVTCELRSSLDFGRREETAFLCKKKGTSVCFFFMFTHWYKSKVRQLLNFTQFNDTFHFNI